MNVDETLVWLKENNHELVDRDTAREVYAEAGQTSRDPKARRGNTEAWYSPPSPTEPSSKPWHNR